MVKISSVIKSLIKERGSNLLLMPVDRFIANDIFTEVN